MAPKTEKMKKAAKALAQQAEFDEKLRKTQAVFPLLNLIYSATRVFHAMDNTYDRVVMAYKDPKLTKILSDYFEYVFYTKINSKDFDTHSRSLSREHAKEMILKYSGIGVTDKMRTDYAKYNRRLVNSIGALSDSRMGPGGLHPNILAAMYGYKDGTHIVIRRLFREIFGDYVQSLSDIVEAYIQGDIIAMLQAIPKNIRDQYESEYRRMYKIPDTVPTDELNIAGKWLADNMTFNR